MRDQPPSWRKLGLFLLAVSASCSSATRSPVIDGSAGTADSLSTADGPGMQPDGPAQPPAKTDTGSAPADVRLSDAGAPSPDSASPDATLVLPTGQLCATRKSELATAMCPGGDAECGAGCTYFLSASQGDDARDGKSPTTAWRSLSKLQGSKLAAGDTVCLRRGDTFRGSVPSPAGLHAPAATPLVYRGYGPAAAARPIVNGAKVVPATWKASSLSPKIMQVSLAGTLSSGPSYQRQGKTYVPREKIFQLFANGQPQRLASFPNPGEGDSVAKGLKVRAGNYSVIDAVPAAGRIQDAQLPTTNALSGAAIDWAGARLFHREIRWVIATADVTSFDPATHTLTLARTPECASDQCVGYGYFLVDNLGALDAPGEWYYDDATQVLYFHPPAGLDLATALVEASLYTADAQPPSWAAATTLPQPAFTVGLDLQNGSGARVHGIVFQHFSEAGVSAIATLSAGSADLPQSTTEIRVEGCAFNYTGPTGVDLERWGDIAGAKGNNRISGNSFIGQTSQALILQTTHSEVACNNVDDIGLLDQYPRFGMFGNGQTASEHGMALLITAGNNTIAFNRVRRTSSAGISFRGPSTTVSNNFIQQACYTKSDCGGIHTYAWDESLEFSAPGIAGSAVVGNIVLESIGTSEGVGRQYDTPMAQGLFLDFGSHDYVVKSNVVALSTTSGILLARNRNVTVDGNLLYANLQVNDMGYPYSQLQFETEFPPLTSTISNNTIAAVAPVQVPMGIRGVTVAQAGKFDGNRYFDPFAYDATSSDPHIDNYLVFVASGDDSTRVGYHLREWAQLSGDGKAWASPLYWQADQVTQELSDNLITNGTFDSGIAGWTTNTWAAASITADTHPLLGPSLRYDRNGAQGGGIGTFSNSFALEAGKTYWVRLWLAPADGVKVPLPPVINVTGGGQAYLPCDKPREITFLLHPETAQSKAQLELTPYPLYGDRFWIDDVVVKQVATQPYDQGTVIRFDQPLPTGVRSFMAYNDTDTEQTLQLGTSTYAELDGAIRRGSVSVPPFGAVVLIPDAWAHNPAK